MIPRIIFEGFPLIIEICWVTNTKFEEKCIQSILVVIDWDTEIRTTVESDSKDFFRYLVNPILNRSNIRVVIHSP